LTSYPFPGRIRPSRPIIFVALGGQVGVSLFGQSERCPPRPLQRGQTAWHSYRNQTAKIESIRAIIGTTVIGIRVRLPDDPGLRIAAVLNFGMGAGAKIR
jgi:hypothetical protein